MDKRQDLEPLAIQDGAAQAGAGLTGPAQTGAAQAGTAPATALHTAGSNTPDAIAIADADAIADAIAIDIEADPTLGSASIQNAVPIVRTLRVTNRSAHTFENIEVRLRCNPAFALPVTLRFDVARLARLAEDGNEQLGDSVKETLNGA